MDDEGSMLADTTLDLALRDQLTGLATATLLASHVGAALTRSVDGSIAAVISIDLDGFRVVNDEFSHLIGDEVLRCVASRLEYELRPGDHLSRLGADAFVLACPGLGGEREAIAIAERIIDTISEPIGTADGTFTVAASLGIALATDQSTPEGILRDAGTAMQRAKDRGGNGYSIYEPAVHGRRLVEAGAERVLRQSIAQDELRLHYQPLVELATGDVVSFEALARWHHPVRGLLAPDEFIPAAERTGQISDVGRWALHAACRQIACWTAADPAAEWARVAVNVSAVQLVDPAFPGHVRSALAESGISAGRLAVELTESALMESSATASRVLSQLKVMGIRVILDDFGTGYSSLGYLARLPVDGIKLDRSFISGEQAERSRPIVEAVVGMAHSLGLSLVGEGVETDDQLDMLRTIGCDFVQGFHVSRPMPAERVAPWVATFRTRAVHGPAAQEPAAQDLIGLGEAAQALGISPSTLRRWADDGRVASERTHGRHRRFAIDDLRALSMRRAGGAQLRADAAVTAPMPALALMLDADGTTLLETAGKGLYERFARGWFAAERSQLPLQEWVRSVAISARSGVAQPALEATAALSRRCEAAGGSLLEISLFLERFSAFAIAAALVHQSGEEQSQTQRLFRHIRRQPLKGR
jgi:diguanylate cyclase (GGDEF)-like protein/excisionase family DNA binding protein